MAAAFPARILVLGASGMLGHALFKILFYNKKYDIYGTVRNISIVKPYYSQKERQSLIDKVEIEHGESIWQALAISKPNVVINCIGVIKQLPQAQNKNKAIMVNALFPHKLEEMCQLINARLIQLSTDCIFNGKKGNYTESDVSDAEDLYGKTKFLGEVDNPNTITLRTSIIGHELQTNIALIDWFLNQENQIKGYSQAYFSGLSTYELANVIENYIIPNSQLYGLYHLASSKISKYHLLKLVADVYGKKINITEDCQYVLDRSLIGDKFNAAFLYQAPTWDEMIQNMYEYFCNWDCYRIKFGSKYIKIR